MRGMVFNTHCKSFAFPSFLLKNKCFNNNNNNNNSIIIMIIALFQLHQYCYNYLNFFQSQNSTAASILAIISLLLNYETTIDSYTQRNTNLSQNSLSGPQYNINNNAYYVINILSKLNINLLQKLQHIPSWSQKVSHRIKFHNTFFVEFICSYNTPFSYTMLTKILSNKQLQSKRKVFTIFLYTEYSKR